MLRALTKVELKRVLGGLCSYDTDTNTSPWVGGGGGGGDQPPSDPPGGNDDPDIDYAYSAIFDDEMDSIENGATEFSYFIPVEAAQTGGGGGGNGQGYDSADYNGPEMGYIDYFATQHGPESIEVRAAISANAFFNYAQRQDQIRTDLTDIVRQAPDAATANQHIDAYLTSVGLGGQLDARITDTGFAAAQQSVQQGPDYGDDIVINGDAYRVGVPNTIASFGTEGQFMLASYLPSNPGSAQVYGSVEGVPASKKYPKLYLLPKNMTDAQKAAVVYNETQGIEDPNDRQVVAALIMQVINNNTGRSYLAASPLATVNGSAQQAAWATAVYAVQQYQNIIGSYYDTTNPAAGATNWIMWTSAGPHTWNGLASQGEYGSFIAAGTSYRYIDFYRDPAYAH